MDVLTLMASIPFRLALQTPFAEARLHSGKPEWTIGAENVFLNALPKAFRPSRAHSLEGVPGPRLQKTRCGLLLQEEAMDGPVHA